MPAQKPFNFRFEDPENQRVHYSKGIYRYCVQLVHKDHVFFRCNDNDQPIYAMPMPDAHHFDRLVLP